MKSLIALLFLAVPAVACKSGEIAMDNGVCAADIKPEGTPMSTPTIDPKIVSNEKPPRNQQPEWQTGAVHADTGKIGVEANPNVGHDYAGERAQK